MRFDIIAAGVGGQGVLTVTALIAMSAVKEGLYVKQSEVHGMAQRGGAVLANLRISARPIHSDLIPEACADMILGMEPVEAARQLSYLSPHGVLVTATDPVVNIRDYPDLGHLLARLRTLPRALMVPAERLAKEAGAPRSANVVLVGAASALMPVAGRGMEQAIREFFGAKGERVVADNLRAFLAGRKALSRAA